MYSQSKGETYSAACIVVVQLCQECDQMIKITVNGVQPYDANGKWKGTAVLTASRLQQTCR